jgi:LemA protein
MDPILLIVLAVVAVVGGWLVLTYNTLVQSRNRADEAWSDIEVQMKRRYDLIPNVVETVKAYARHEEGVFSKVSQARAAAMGAKSAAEHASAETALSQSLMSLFAVAEAYPSLQAAGNFLHLQTELVDAEDKIQAARRFYNGNVRDFNTRVQTFPANLIANTFGFRAREFFDAPDIAAEPVKVQF